MENIRTDVRVSRVKLLDLTLRAMTLSSRRKSSLVVVHSKRREQPFEKSLLPGRIFLFCWRKLSEE